jgi:glutathione synthase/RimK-type ligase-like ATP-grasp enzyme
MAMAVHCVSALGLDFGAVDVIENKKGSWILEVNTAPGLEGQTLEVYRSAFEQKIRDRR